MKIEITENLKAKKTFECKPVDSQNTDCKQII